MSAPLRIVFAGTPDFAVPTLQALINLEYNIVGVYTQPDRPAGRGRKLTASPVKQLALEHDIPVFQPQTFRAQATQKDFANLKPDLMIVIAYGLILPQVVLDTPKHGCINIHGSLLPRWRGAAPIQRAIQAGDTETGITIMQMEAGLDTGPMLHKFSTPIYPTDTSKSLYDRLAVIGSEAMISVLNMLSKCQLSPKKQQDELATYADKITKSESVIDWSKPAINIERTIRSFVPWPTAQTYINNQTIKILEAEAFPGKTSIHSIGEIIETNKQGISVQTQDGILLIKALQLPGGKPQPAHAILNAKRDWFIPGACFGDQHHVA